MLAGAVDIQLAGYLRRPMRLISTIGFSASLPWAGVMFGAVLFHRMGPAGWGRFALTVLPGGGLGGFGILVFDIIVRDVPARFFWPVMLRFIGHGVVSAALVWICIKRQRPGAVVIPSGAGLR